jgi:amino acid adenylation domain-containing protein
VLAAQLAYWREELADAPAVIDLPIDKPRPPVQTYNGAFHPLQLSAELSTQLRELSRRHGSTLFMTLLAAFDLLLCRYAGQEQVLVGTPIANRNRSETESLIGCFFNTLVLRGDVRGNPSFGELLRRVREVALGAYAHQDLPFEKLVEELQPERDMSRPPLFQVMFILQNAPGEVLELEGLSLSEVESAGETAKLELTLALQEQGGVIVGGVSYNRDLYEAETIGRLVESYERVLRAVVADPEQRVLEIELLSEAQRRQIIEGWNETAAAYPRELTLSELFEAQAARTPEAIALLFEATSLSYRELNERANQLARYLQRKGVGPEALVGILMNRSVEMIVGVLSILKAGGAYVPLDPTYPVERLAFMVQDSGMRLLLTQRDLLSKVPELEAKMIALDEAWEQIAAESVVNPPVLTTPDNLAYVIYTSGSTGKPKGVQIQHRSLINLLTTMGQRPGLTAGDVLLSVSSLSFDMVVPELFLPLLNGARLVVASREESRDGGLLMARLAASGATVFQATPATWNLLLEAGWPGDKGLQVLCGAEAWGLKLAQELAARSRELWNLYGPTETTVWSSLSKVNGTSPVTLGMPVANTQFYVLDRHLQPVPIGVAGELYIAGDGLARGYLKRPELTAEKFVANPFSPTPGARMYRTGDRVRYLASGELEFLERMDQQVKLRGFRIELGEIESVLSSHPEITESVVLVQQDKHGEKRLVAYIVGENEPASSELHEYLRERLPEYMVPQGFVSLPALPLTPNSKIDRRALQAMKIELDRRGESLIEPRDVVELQLAHIWEELLDVRDVGVHDDFFRLGGHSLLAVRLTARIQASFGQNLPLASLFQGATIEKQARLLREQQPAHSASLLVAIQSKGEGLPFFCVHPGGGNVICYRELSNHLGLEQPFYGIHSRGLLENQVAHTRIEDMAAYYIEDIRRVQPDGPYLLGGWSMGGVIAFEMARQLEAKGQRVSLLALISAKLLTPEEAAARWDEVEFVTRFARNFDMPLDKLKISTDELYQLDSEALLGYVLQRAIAAEMVPQDVQLAVVRRVFEVFKGNVEANENYRPQVSSQRITLFKGDKETVETPDETMGWGVLTSGEVEVHTVPGSDHFTIGLEPYVRSLAEQLTDCIRRAKKE